MSGAGRRSSRQFLPPSGNEFIEFAGVKSPATPSFNKGRLRAVSLAVFGISAKLHLPRNSSGETLDGRDFGNFTHFTNAVNDTPFRPQPPTLPVVACKTLRYQHLQKAGCAGYLAP